MGRVESAFVSGGAIRYEDLSISAMICAMNYKDGCNTLDSIATPKAMLKWSKRLTRTRLVDRILRRKPTPIRFQEEVSAFREYMDGGSWHPDYIASGSGEQTNLPYEQIVRVTLMRDLGFSESELMDRPLVHSLTDFYTLHALSGTVRLTDLPPAEELNAQLDALDKWMRDRNGNRS
jgi:hypothetical protein